MSTPLTPPPGDSPQPDLINLPPQMRVEAVIDHAFGGLHHVKGWKQHEEGKYPYWTCSVQFLCNWDFDNLSRLVVASLEYGVRIELSSGGPYRLKLQMFPRYSREGDIFTRIPKVDHFLRAFDTEWRGEQAKGASK